MLLNETATPNALLERLAAYIETLPESYAHFDMESYFHDPRLKLATEQDEMVHSIDLMQPVEGMCGCLLGHSAAAGVRWNPNDYTDWREFAKVVYGVDDTAFEYLFSGDWYVEDNTPEGAAQRIRTYIEQGVPVLADA